MCICAVGVQCGNAVTLAQDHMMGKEEADCSVLLKPVAEHLLLKPVAEHLLSTAAVEPVERMVTQLPTGWCVLSLTALKDRWNAAAGWGFATTSM